MNSSFLLISQSVFLLVFFFFFGLVIEVASLLSVYAEVHFKLDLGFGECCPIISDFFFFFFSLLELYFV